MQAVLEAAEQEDRCADEDFTIQEVRMIPVCLHISLISQSLNKTFMITFNRWYYGEMYYLQIISFIVFISKVLSYRLINDTAIVSIKR